MSDSTSTPHSDDDSRDSREGRESGTADGPESRFRPTGDRGAERPKMKMRGNWSKSRPSDSGTGGDGRDAAPRRSWSDERPQRENRGGDHRSSSNDERPRRNWSDNGNPGRREGGFNRDRNDNAPRRDGGFNRGRSEGRPVRSEHKGQRKMVQQRHMGQDRYVARDKPRHPWVDDDVTGKETSKAVFAQLKNLQPENAIFVGKHMVMAERYLDIDPERAHLHAQAAVSRAGRIAPVREAAGICAYGAGHFDIALRELRTYRRMTGNLEHLALIVDCERALKRQDKALETAAEAEVDRLSPPARVELAIVVSGIHEDQEQFEQALAALEIPQLDFNRAFEYSPRLFRRYAEVLALLERAEEAAKWERQAAFAAHALGHGEDDEEIIDFLDDEPEEEPTGKRGDESPAQEQERDSESAGEAGDSREEEDAS